MMADLNVPILIKNGNYANLPAEAALGELLFCNDTKQLFVGQGAGQALKEITQLIDVNRLFSDATKKAEIERIGVNGDGKITVDGVALPEPTPDTSVASYPTSPVPNQYVLLRNGDGTRSLYEWENVPGVATNNSSLEGTSAETFYTPVSPSKLALGGKWTVAFWFRSKDTNQGSKYIGCLGNNEPAFLYNFGTTNTIDIYSTSQGGHVPGSGIPCSDTNWHHYAWTYSNGTSGGDNTLRTYKDGVLVASTTVMNWSPWSATMLSFMSAVAGGGTNYVNGLIDEIQIWSEVRDMSTWNYIIDNPTSVANLKLYVTGEEGSGTLFDKSANPLALTNNLLYNAADKPSLAGSGSFQWVKKTLS